MPCRRFDHDCRRFGLSPCCLVAVLVAKQSEVNNLRNEVQLLKFELDRLNQYSRRDSVRISGIPESEDENTNDIVKQLAADIGVTLTPNDISVSHRLPGRQGTAKPIIVKFVRRDMKTAFMKNKRRLRDLNRKGVFLNDDLTPFRAKLTRVLRTKWITVRQP